MSSVAEAEVTGRILLIGSDRESDLCQLDQRDQDNGTARCHDNRSMGFEAMKIDISMAVTSRTSVRDDPCLHPCLKRMQRILESAGQPMKRLCCGICRSVRSSFEQVPPPPDDEDQTYHDLTLESTWKEHCHNLTCWSRIQCLALLVVMLGFISLSSYALVTIILIVEVFAILYFIYWRNHRLDLSLNRTIHYFAMGAALSVLWAILQYFILEFLFYTLSSAGSVSSILQMKSDPLWVLFHSFVVMGFAGEFLKYKGYMMISQQQHKHIAITTKQPPNGDDCQALLAADNNILGTFPFLLSRAAITCAMLSVGTGFGWVANSIALYNHGKWVPQLGGKLCILPMHALLAAIQSIGLCSRDLEGNPKPLILLPAALLHGLTAYFLSKLRGLEFHSPLSLVETLYLAAPWLMVLASFLYYVVLAARQRSRLRAMTCHQGLVDEDDAGYAIPGTIPI